MEIKIDTINEKYKSAYVNGPLGATRMALEREGYELISLEQMAQLRLCKGKDALISKNGCRTRESFVYIPQSGFFLTKNSHLIKDSRMKDNMPLSQRQIDLALCYSVKVTKTEIPVLRLAEEELTSYIFGKYAKQYGELLKSMRVELLEIFLDDISEKPFARQATILDLGSGSHIHGVGLCSKNGTTRGIKLLDKSGYLPQASGSTGINRVSDLEKKF